MRNKDVYSLSYGNNDHLKIEEIQRILVHSWYFILALTEEAEV